MIFNELPLAGAYIIHPEPLPDERGFFARLWCRREFAARGLETRLVQSSVSYNKSAGTLRGMHYQAPPHEEVKIVRCTRGSIFDVIIDLRRESPTFLKHQAAELTASNRRMLYVPAGFAHGFQTLEDDTEVMYFMSEFFAPASARGVRWDDPMFKIVWPHTDRRIIAPRDAAYPDFTDIIGEPR